ncbi:MAG: phage major capsid protein, partial [Dehalococcoidia bacterium]|nr:phage major capsid protein [Dehalococcoidia bacterium]
MSDAVAELKQAFADFKALNDRRYEELKNGIPSAETLVAVDQANAAITEIQSKLDAAVKEHAETKMLVDELETRANRPHGGGGNGQLKLRDEQVERYAAFQGMVQDKDIDPAHVDLEFIGSYIDAFADWMKRGSRASSDSIRLLNEMSVGSDPGGGYWVDPDTSGRLVEFIRETTPMRRLASV